MQLLSTSGPSPSIGDTDRWDDYIGYGSITISLGTTFDGISTYGTVQKRRNRRRRDDRANGAKITEAMKVGDITFPLRITVTPECFPSLNQSKKILFCIEINETKPFLCSYYRHVDYRRAVMKKWRKKRMTCLPSISAPLSTTMSKLCSEWTIPPHIDNMM